MSLRTRSSLPCDKVLLSLLGGFAFGAIVVALSAPKTGREVRKTLGDVGRRLLGKPEAMDLPEDEWVEAMFI